MRSAAVRAVLFPLYVAQAAGTKHTHSFSTNSSDSLVFYALVPPDVRAEAKELYDSTCHALTLVLKTQ